MIIVFGSINMDVVSQVERFPHPGETVLSPGYDMLPGGKGANQALAATRMGAKVALAGCVGNDGMGMRMLAGLRRDGVITSGVSQSEVQPTGMTLILTDPHGENQSTLAAGANNEATHDQIPDNILTPQNMLLIQADMQSGQNWALLRRAKMAGTQTMVNLSPARPLTPEVMRDIDYLILNQIEARQLAEFVGIKQKLDETAMALAFAKLGNLTCVITMAGDGSVAAKYDGTLITAKALPIDKVVDTTGAGDAYCGTLAACLHDRKPLPVAMKYAAVAGSLACLKRGTQDSYAYQGDIEEHLPRMPEPAVRKI